MYGSLGGMPFGGMFGGGLGNPMIANQINLALLRQTMNQLSHQNQKQKVGEKMGLAFDFQKPLAGQKRTAPMKGPLNLPEFPQSKTTKSSNFT